jgi:hypothetical protein
MNNMLVKKTSSASEIIYWLFGSGHSWTQILLPEYPQFLILKFPYLKCQVEINSTTTLEEFISMFHLNCYYSLCRKLEFLQSSTEKNETYLLKIKQCESEVEMAQNKTVFNKSI